MMNFRCRCGMLYNLSDQMEGWHIPCRVCGQMIRVPTKHRMEVIERRKTTPWKCIVCGVENPPGIAREYNNGLKVVGYACMNHPIDRTFFVTGLVRKQVRG